MNSHQLANYPLLQKTIATIILQILQGIVEKKPIHVGIDNPNFFLNYPEFDQMLLRDWEKHVSAYAVVYGSVAISSIVVGLEHRLNENIFEEGTYFCNFRAGSFEIEVNSSGELSQIIAEFEGKTPSFIPQILAHYPAEAFPSLEELQGEMSPGNVVDDQMFLAGLTPWPYEIITVE